MYKILLLEKFDCLGDLDYKLNKDPVVVDYQLVEELVLNVIDCLVPPRSPQKGRRLGWGPGL